MCDPPATCPETDNVSAMKRTRPLRLFGAIAALGAAAWAWSPHVTGHVTTTAVVNAPMTTLTSPFDGRIVAASPAEGAVVPTDAPVLRIRRRARERDAAAELVAARDGRQRQIRALRQQIDAVDDRIGELTRRTRAHVAASAARLRADLRAARADTDLAAAELARARKDLERVESLAAKGYRSGAKLDAARADLATAKASRAAADARAAAARTALDAIQRGTFVGRGYDDVPYSQRRLDRLGMHRRELTAEIDRLTAEHDALASRVTRVRARVAQARRYAPLGAGVVWRASPAAGSPVAEGEAVARLIDCRARFIEAHVDPEVAGAMAVGDRARFRVLGTERWHAGRVRAVRGAGSHAARDRLAARAPSAADDSARVIVAPPATGFADSAVPFCHVGRTVEVRLDRKAPLRGVRTAAQRAVTQVADALAGAAGADGPPDAAAPGQRDASP